MTQASLIASPMCAWLRRPTRLRRTWPLKTVCSRNSATQHRQHSLSPALAQTMPALALIAPIHARHKTATVRRTLRSASGLSTMMNKPIETLRCQALAVQVLQGTNQRRGRKRLLPSEVRPQLAHRLNASLHLLNQLHSNVNCLPASIVALSLPWVETSLSFSKHLHLVHSQRRPRVVVAWVAVA